MPGKLGGMRPSRAWVVESDRARNVPLASWSPDDPAAGATPLAKGTFTAATGGDLGWAGIYDNVGDRLAFHDDLADLSGATAPLTYVVVGWYADPTLDPLHPPTDPVGFTALLADLGWDADLSSLAEAQDDLAVADLHLRTLAGSPTPRRPPRPPARSSRGRSRERSGRRWRRRRRSGSATSCSATTSRSR
jgi:hypothetical protein